MAGFLQRQDAYPQGGLVADGSPQVPGLDLSFRISASHVPVHHGVFNGVDGPTGLRTLNGAAAASMVRGAFDTRPNTVSHLLTGNLAPAGSPSTP